MSRAGNGVAAVLPECAIVEVFDVVPPHDRSGGAVDHGDGDGAGLYKSTLIRRFSTQQAAQEVYPGATISPLNVRQELLVAIVAPTHPHRAFGIPVRKLLLGRQHHIPFCMKAAQCSDGSGTYGWRATERQALHIGAVAAGSKAI